MLDEKFETLSEAEQIAIYRILKGSKPKKPKMIKRRSRSDDDLSAKFW